MITKCEALNVAHLDDGENIGISFSACYDKRGKEKTATNPEATSGILKGTPVTKNLVPPFLALFLS